MSIELRPDGAYAFTANNGGTVSAINLATQTVTPITVGAQAQDARMRPGTDELWVSNYGSSTISIVNTLIFTETSSFDASGNPGDIAFSANGSRAYVTMPLLDTVHVFDAVSRDLIQTYSVADVPSGIVVDAERNRLIVASEGNNANGNRINFINLSTGATTALALGNGPSGIYLDATRDRAYVSLFFSSAVAVVDLSNDTLVANLSTNPQPNGMRGSFDGRLLFVSSSNRVSVIELDGPTVRTQWATPTSTNDVVMSPDGRTVYSTALNSDAVSVAKLEVDRFAGSDRYATAIEMSKEAYPGTNEYVYIASGTSFPDALSLSPAVSVNNGPLLLNPQSALRADVLLEIQRLDPDTIYIAGGTGVISPTVQAQLEATGAVVERLSGADRYETSRAIVREFFANPTGYSDLYLVTGRDFPDALSAGAAAAANGMPMLLVDGSASAVSPAILAAITDLQPARVIVVGGTGVMSVGIQNQIDALAAVTVVRAAGTDRYATSVAVTELGFDYRTSSASYWATGADFPDALAGITLAAPENAPIYLVRPTCVPDGVLHGAWRHNAERIGILGGTGVISAGVEQSLTRC